MFCRSACSGSARREAQRWRNYEHIVEWLPIEFRHAYSLLANMSVDWIRRV